MRVPLTLILGPQWPYPATSARFILSTLYPSHPMQCSRSPGGSVPRDSGGSAGKGGNDERRHTGEENGQDDVEL